MIEIRLPRVADEVGCRTLAAAVIGEERAGAFIRSHLERHHLIVAEADGEVVAFALFFTNFSTFLGKPGLYLEDLIVTPAERGQGIGQALLERLARIAVERDYGRFEWSVLDWNENAIRFYERMGASVMPEWRICRVTGDALCRLGG